MDPPGETIASAAGLVKVDQSMFCQSVRSGELTLPCSGPAVPASKSKEGSSLPSNSRISKGMNR